MIIQTHMRYKSSLHATIIKADGARIELGDLDKGKSLWRRFVDRVGFDQRGLVTNAGAFYLTETFVSDSSEPLDVFVQHDCGTGNTAAAVTQTALVSPAGTARVAGTNTASNSVPGSPTLTSVATINFTGTLAIVEWGLFSASSSGTMWDRRVFSAINVTNGDAIQFTYVLTVASGGS
jgi:hypothetical protein